MVSKLLVILCLHFYVVASILATILICRDGRYQCENKGACIPYEYVCDGRNDCSDSSDETNCTNGRSCKIKKCSHVCYQNPYDSDATCTCPGGYNLAPDARTCIDINECLNTLSLCSQNCTNTPGSYACSCFDGFTQNTDGSCKSVVNGEVERPRLVCTGGKHPCDNGESCISEGFVCDGSMDCGDGSDETNCQSGRYCKLKQCEQTCTDNYDNYGHYSSRTRMQYTSCSCRNGFTLNSNSKTCDDIDECTPGTHNCTQICTNNRGSFVCSCDEGYYYDSRSLTCKASGTYPLLYISTGPKIYIHNVKRHRTYSVSINETGTVEKIIYDRYNKRIISLETFPNGGQIVTFDEIDQKRKNVFFEYEFANPVDLAYDWISRKAYVTDPGNGLIVACDLELGKCTTVVEKNLARPTKIVLDPIERTMYWIDLGKWAGVYSSGMDGWNVTVMADKDIYEPTSIAFDHSTKTLLWADKKGLYSVIEAIHIPSMRRFNLYTDVPKTSSNHVMNKPKLDSTITNLGIFEDVVYLSTELSRVYSFPKMNKTIDPKIEISLNTLKLLSFSIHHPLLSPFDKYTNTCNEANCTEMCLLSPDDGYTCSPFVISEGHEIAKSLELESSEELTPPPNLLKKLIVPEKGVY